MCAIAATHTDRRQSGDDDPGLTEITINAQKKTFRAKERDTERVQTERLDFWQQIADIRVEDLIFIDEAGVNLAMTRLYARALKGQRATSTRTNQPGKNQTMIGAIALSGIVAALTFEGSTDGPTFLAFVKQVLVPNLWEGACVILDNLKAHHVEGVVAAIEAVGAKVIYLPPYSPDFNPIELFWSKVKNRIRDLAPDTSESLYEAIVKSFKSVTKTDLLHWITYCCYCTSPA
jgi:transposase